MTVDKIPIGKFSAATRLTQKALRYYDEKGILVPQAKDNITGYRYYTANQIAITVKIKTLHRPDFIEAENLGDRDAVKTLLHNHLARTREEIIRLERVAALLLTIELTS